jgi:glyceraldehyde 3-phosphate dehydrogenase
MAKAKVGINGFGRIGRNFFRAHLERGGDFEVVAANDLGDAKTMAHLLKHDSVLGRLEQDVSVGEGSIKVGKDEIQLLSERDPKALPWGDLDVDIVLESTGLFTDREGAAQHLDAGAAKVVISAPATDPDVTLVLGVNDDEYDPENHRIVSNASCTTNCVAPMAKVLHDALTIESGFMTTIHASTGAAKAIGIVMPALQGKVDGMSMRAPVPDGSVTDLVVQVSKDTSVDAVNELFRAAAESGPLEGLLAYSDEPLVSQDIVGSPNSCTFDSQLTMVHGRLVKVFGWYDNEWGYSCRLVDLVSKMAGAALPKPETAATA